MLLIREDTWTVVRRATHVIDADGYLNCTLDDGTIHRIKVEKSIYVPTLTGSLLSVKKLTSKGNTVEFTDNQCFIRKNEKLLAVGRLANSLYKLLCKHKLKWQTWPSRK